MKKNKQDLIKSSIKNDADLFRFFGKYARYIFGDYVIDFNDKFLSAKTPSGLFEKVKEEFKTIK